MLDNVEGTWRVVGDPTEGALLTLARKAQLAVPDGAALTAIIRDDQVLLPDRAGALEGGDIVVALCEPGREHALHDLLTAG